MREVGLRDRPVGSGSQPGNLDEGGVLYKLRGDPKSQCSASERQEDE